MVTIRDATSADLDLAKTLFREYEAEADAAICFSGFERELAELPGAYAPPNGRLLLAEVDGAAAGCVALRPTPSEPREGEMKRLYVRPAFRKSGAGRLLVVRLVDEARAVGYRAVRLDTLPSMRAAQALYRSLGFLEIAPYNDNPVAGTLFMRLAL